ncbi:MATE family efflux transporter [Bacillus marinisedimentorum]|uniref:MATE family efflux transporter n=1 Tax=Bacillus marinisedimentorum TaxID=1821260 RepID=UPI0007E26EEA|nr:MATE family efflux transporter [Bacillus marinisedimentorum]
MYKTDTMKQKILLLLTILWPILVTQAGMFSMNLVDTIMSGRAGADDLAGVAIGTSLWIPIFTGLNGILIAVTPIVSQLLGADLKNNVPRAVVQGLYLAIALALFVILTGSFLLGPILDMMKIEPDVRYIAFHYLTGLSFGMVPLFMYTVLRSFIDALGQTRVSMRITFLVLPVNIFFNYILIFGKMGFPELGGAGAGYATAITYWTFFLAALLIVHRSELFISYRVFRNIYRPSWAAWKEQLTIGVPIGLTIFFETSIFSVVTLLMSEFNTATIAAHQAALNFTSMLYMIPLSISMALTIAVGFEVGGKRVADANAYSKFGLGIAVAMAFASGLFLYLFNKDIAVLYSDNSAVIRLTQHFIIYAIFYQLSDAIQAPVLGILRGYKDVNIPFVISLVSYWLIGLPIGYGLAQYTGLGPFGYWIGIIAGLTAAAAGASIRLYYIQRRFKARFFASE